MAERKYLLVPELKAGHGTGHLRRAMHLAAELPGAAIVVPVDRQKSLEAAFPELHRIPMIPMPRSGNYVILLDKPEIEEHEIDTLTQLGTVIGLETRGPAAARCAYVIDTLPRALAGSKGQSAYNIADRNFLDLPPRKISDDALHARRKSVGTILVTFGGEDSKGQTSALARSGWLESTFPGASVTWVRGPLMKSLALEAWSSIDAPSHLASMLGDFDLVITMFGLTAYEAMAAGSLVLLWNPTRYHHELACKDGLPSLGIAGMDHLPSSIDELLDQALHCSLSARPSPRSLAQFIQGLQLPVPWTCPACGSRDLKVIDRFPTRTYADCRMCGMTSMLLVEDQKIDYSPQYFFEAYQSQYGKTYLEDFSHIKAMGLDRLKRIKKYGPTKGRLLDLGCAFGPFLAAADEVGYEVEGIDISPEAVRYCSEVLGYPARTIDLTSALPHELCRGKPFDVITLWYVIEHVPDLKSLLELLSASLAFGGLLAIATPSAAGISSRRDLHGFLDKSPMDHYTIWHPKRVARMLSPFGLEVIATHGSGHHPERMGGMLGLPAFRPLGQAVSRAAGLADTFELFARKKAAQ